MRSIKLWVMWVMLAVAIAGCKGEDTGSESVESIPTVASEAPEAPKTAPKKVEPKAGTGSVEPVPEALPVVPVPEALQAVPEPLFVGMDGGAAATLALVRAAGDRAAVSVVLRHQHWRAFGKLAGPLLADALVKEGVPREVFKAEDLNHALAVAFGDANHDRWPRKLPGLDASRPLVAGLFEPAPGPVALGTRYLAMTRLEEGGPGIRHRVLLPATDVRALLNAVISLFEGFGGRRIKTIGSMAELNGGAIFGVSWDGFAAVVPGDGFVRIEILSHERVAADVADPAGMKVRWAAMLGGPPQPGECPATPALRRVVQSNEFAAVLVRPWVWSDLAVQLGAYEVVRAGDHVDPAYRQQALAKTVNAAHAATRLMSREWAVVDDVAFLFEATHHLRLSMVASLNEYGRKVFDAGLKTAGRPFAGKAQALLEGFCALDVRAMLNLAVLPVGFAELKRIDELAQGLAECGALCTANLAAGGWLGLLKLAVEFAPDQLDLAAAGLLPNVVTARLLAIDPADAEAPVKFALGAQFGAEGDSEAIRDLVTEMQDRLRLRMQTDLERTKDDVRLRLAVGAPPTEVFPGAWDARAPDLVLYLKANPGSLADHLARVEPEVGALVKRCGQLDVLGWHMGEALFVEAVVGLTDGMVVPYTPPEVIRGMKWESPRLARERSAGGQCLAELSTQMGRVHASLAMVAPGSRGELMAGAIEELRPKLKCALAQESTRAEAEAADLMLALMASDRLGTDGNQEGRRKVLREACDRGRQRACAEYSSALATVPTVF